MKNTTISVRIDKNALDVINFVIQNGAPGYCKSLSAKKTHSDIEIRLIDMNFAAFWHKISVQLVNTKVVNPSKKRSMSIDVNHWALFTNLMVWYQSPDPYLGVIFRDINEQMRQKIVLLPRIFARDE